MIGGWRGSGVCQDLIRRIKAGEIPNLGKDHGAHAVAYSWNGQDGRMDFIHLGRGNLNLLRNGLRDFIEKYRPVSLRIFVSDGYDPEFERVETTLEGMLDDLEAQVIEDFFLEARVYDLEMV